MPLRYCCRLKIKIKNFHTAPRVHATTPIFEDDHHNNQPKKKEPVEQNPGIEPEAGLEPATLR
jgi:hypothetical protein